MNFCCGTCTKSVIVNNFTQTNTMNLSSINSSHFVFPIRGNSALKKLYGFHYIPIIEVPPTFLITKRVHSEEILEHLVVSCSELWPLLLMCILMAIIAGFPVWLIETWINKDEFPRSFLIGIFEGFWWSFVSMTTVGYGDRAPRFFLSKLIAVIWILLGVTIMSMFTAALTMEILSKSNPHGPSMAASRIGVLNGRILDASIVMNKGGHVEISKDGSMTSGITELLTQLRTESINGFVVDKQVYVSTLTTYKQIAGHGNHQQKTDANFFLSETLHTEIPHSGEVYSYGILVKERMDYEYFIDFIKDNKHNVQICKELHMHTQPNHQGKNTRNIFSSEFNLFRRVLKGIAIILGFLILFGLLYEIMRRKLRGKRSKNNSIEMTNN